MKPQKPACDQIERLTVYALRTLPEEQVPALEAHLASCDACQQELDQLRPIVDFFVNQANTIRPPEELRERLARRLGDALGHEIVLPTTRQLDEPDWEEVAPGISCKLLATDTKQKRVSMLVRLAPGIAYPPHTHAGVEELHLLEGELWINDRKLLPGDYSFAEPGSSDQRVWSETGCMCVLVTSAGDVLK
ncbi:MAG TPA: cupin domain-containing protein [Steroidobacteraceae bacterium]|nr:cupin domain-containing protein [Steroidobacteraceae bacterium]